MQPTPNKTPQKFPNPQQQQMSPYPQYQQGYSPNVVQNPQQMGQSPIYAPNQMRPPTMPMQYQQPPITSPVNPNMMPGYIHKSQLPSQFTPNKQPQVPYGYTQTPPQSKTGPTMNMGMSPNLQPQYRTPGSLMTSQNQVRPKDPTRPKPQGIEDIDKSKIHNPDYKTPFQSFSDISERLSVYRPINQDPVPDDKWDQKVSDVTKKFIKQKEKLNDGFFHLMYRDSRRPPIEETLFMDICAWKEEEREWEEEKKQILAKRELERIAKATIGSTPISFKLEAKKEEKVFNVLDDDDDDPSSGIQLDLETYESIGISVQKEDHMENGDDLFVDME